MNSPPIIQEAIQESFQSPCSKSSRGVVIWDPKTMKVLSVGFNHPPQPFGCSGSSECRKNCSSICIHAEADALMKLETREKNLEMAHVKTVGGKLVPSGGPSCWQCSRTILADGRISGMWLFHESGWKRYDVEEFHELTLRACNLPLFKGC